MNRTTPIIKNYAAQNANSTEADKLYPEESCLENLYHITVLILFSLFVGIIYGNYW